MSEYADLRTLLLGREIDAIDQLRFETERLAGQIEEPEQVVTRLSPLIDRILQRNIELAPDAVIDTLAPIIARVLEQQIRNSGDVLAETLAPVIGNAIRAQIRTHRDDVVDALYPVIGNTVAKYVSHALKDLLESVNARMQRTFSLTALRRKMRARIQGIPESELLLHESIGWNVEAIFLIQKTSGLLMGEFFSDTSKVSEPEMVASMLTAIRSFVNDWIARHEDGAEINQIEYGGSTIYLEVAGASYLAVVLKGRPSGKLVNIISAAFSGLIEEYADAIAAFDGDRSALPEEAIRAMMHRIMSCRSDIAVPKKSYAPLYLFGVFMASLAVYAGYVTVVNMQNAAATKRLDERFSTDPLLALYRVGAVVGENQVRIVGAVPDVSLKREAERIVQEYIPDARIEDALILARPFEGTRIERNTRRIEAAQQAFELPAVATRFYFSRGNAELGTEDREKLDLLHLLLRLNPEAVLTLTGYSDQVGTDEQRIAIAQKRARAVHRALMAAGADGSRISLSVSSHFPGETGTEPMPTEKKMAEARCVIASFVYPAKTKEQP